MPRICPPFCAQGQRALRLLISPDRPQVDRPKLIEALPGPTPEGFTDILDLLIQILLALCENADKPDNNNGPQPNGEYDELYRAAAEIARETVPPEILQADLPKLIASIQSIASMIPNPGFSSNRAAREAMRVANNRALEDSATNWQQWNAATLRELDRLAEDKTLTTQLQYKRAWLTVAQALDSLR